MRVNEFDLEGISVHISDPRVIAEADNGRCWYPDLLKFSTGEIMLNYSLNADDNHNETNTQAVCISFDGGDSFGFQYDVNGFHNGCGEPRISLDDGSIVGTSTFLKMEKENDHRTFLGHRWIYEKGGRSYTVEPWGVRVSGLPGDVSLIPEKSRTWIEDIRTRIIRLTMPWVQKAGKSRTWWSRINWFGDIVAVDDGSWISTISMRFEGDQLESTVAVRSADMGKTWEYISTIAGPDDVPYAQEGFDEPCLLHLGENRLLCISRVGSGKDQFLARAVSPDAGRSWSKPQKMQAYSVAPQICRFDSRILALVTGRPGLFLWLCEDENTERWHCIDLMEHHNQTVKDWKMNEKQTSAYISILKVEGNKAFVAYDRSPFGWRPVPDDSGERSQIWLVEISVSADKE